MINFVQVDNTYVYFIFFIMNIKVLPKRCFNYFHCRPTVWTWRALSLEFARRREGFGGMPIASFFRVVDISFE
jgi:hypothetical protein